MSSSAAPSRSWASLVARKLDLAVCYAVPRQPDIQFLARGPSNPALSSRAAIRWPTASRSGWPTAPGTASSCPTPRSASRSILEKALRRAELHPAAMVTTNSIEVMKTLVREHHQIALLALPDIHSDLLDGEFVHIPFADRHVRGFEPVVDRSSARPSVAGGGDGGRSPEGPTTAIARQIAPSSKTRRRVRKVELLAPPLDGCYMRGAVQRHWGTA